MIYLDNAATTYPKPEEVYEAMDRVNREMCVNAGRGSYSLARKASEMIYQTKDLLRGLVSDERSSPVVFAPSVTIALNQIIRGISWEYGNNVYVSPYEHNAVARTLHQVAAEHNLNIRQLPLKGKTLEIDIEKIKYQFSKERPAAVFCTHISNVTGYILPVSEVFSEAKEYGAITVLDAAQSLGLIPVNSNELNADIIAFAGHKTLYGPFGIGGFINIGNVKLDTLLTGGTGSDSLNLNMPTDNESRYEPASINIVSISGLKAAITSLREKDHLDAELRLTKYLVKSLEAIDGIKLYLTDNINNHVGIISFSIDGFNSSDIGLILDEDYNICVRTGYHCAPYIHDYLDDKTCSGTVRIGLGQFNTADDIDNLINALKEIVEQ